jgi:hypothetical protein
LSSLLHRTTVIEVLSIERFICELARLTTTACITAERAAFARTRADQAANDAAAQFAAAVAEAVAAAVAEQVAPPVAPTNMCSTLLRSEENMAQTKSAASDDPIQATPRAACAYSLGFRLRSKF